MDEELSRTCGYGTEFLDGIPVVAEDTTYNIHGGRDMFAKHSSVKTKKHPPVAKKPSKEQVEKVLRQRPHDTSQNSRMPG